MALSGQLSDLSLAELIEFFCSQRKTGRLRVSYPRAPGFFYFQNGTMVDATIGALNGVDAVYYALTLQNASFNFSAAFESSRRTIHEPWEQVALEGLRRMDEGVHPGEAFPERHSGDLIKKVEADNERSVPEEKVTEQPEPLEMQASDEPSVSEEVEREQPEPVGIQASDEPSVSKEVEREQPEPLEMQASDEPHVSEEVESEKPESVEMQASDEPVLCDEKENEQPEPVAMPTPKPAYIANFPMALSVEHATSGGHSKTVYGAIAAAVLLSIAAAGYPAGWYSKRQAPSLPQPAAVSTQEQPLIDNSGNPPSVEETGTEPGEASSIIQADEPAIGPVDDGKAFASRRDREARERDRWKAEEARINPATAKPGESPNGSTVPADTARKVEPAKAKTTTVQVTYDEAGRVTQASGGDANALRIARQKRFPAGKPGTATVTIPVN